MLWRSLQKSAKTKGEIIERREIINNIQTKTNGNVSHLEFLQFKYSFTVNGIIHTDSCFLKYSFINANELQRIRKQKLPVLVEIRYNPYNLKESMLWIP
ncbi:hypothetical protein GCM10008119_04460 [Pedobacter mendelii]|uniref:Uncharacterized protein n=1 Tax=Pedobacter mendelii TaxID=1908240 RepID=A0ABQ2BCJ8_9SPHI|nr:hypothetical protein GCM10008119_04460 [Pedobacter mendelii]